MLDYGFANYAYFTPEKVELNAIPVCDGTQDTVKLSADTSGILLPKASAGGIKTEVLLEESLNAPVTNGQVVGTIRYKKGEDIVFETEIVTTEAVDKINFVQIFHRLVSLFFIGNY